MINKFIKRPVPIEAVKCIRENQKDILELLQKGTTEYDIIVTGGKVIGYHIHSWEGVDPVYYDPSENKNGNNKPYWIIKGLKGEVYPCVADDVCDAPLGYTLVDE